MIRSKAINLLKSLNKNEFKDFKLFLDSRLHNSNNALVRLCKLLTKYYPEFGHKNLTKEKIYFALYSSKKYNDSTIRYLLSDLLRAGEEYLVHLNLNRSKFERRYFLLDELLNRGLFDVFVKNSEEAREALGEIANSDGRYRYKIFLLGDLNVLYSYLASDSKIMKKGFNYAEIEENLVDYFYSELMNQYIIAINRMNVTMNKGMPELKYINLINNNNERLKNNKDPVIRTRYHNLMLLLSDLQSETDYNSLSDLFFDTPKISTDKWNTYCSLNAYLTGNIKKHSKTYAVSSFKIFSYMSLNNFFGQFDNVFFDVRLYRNILLICYNLGEIKWLEKFIEKYLPQIHHEYTQNLINLNNALKSFHFKNFEDALEYCSKISYEDYGNKFYVSSITIQSLFELGKCFEAISKTDSFKRHITAGKNIPANFKKICTDYIKLVEKLINLKIENTPEKAIFLRKAIESSDYVYNIDWLLDKVDELISK